MKNISRIKISKGLTLIEILAIVIILGIVSAIAVNSFMGKIKDGELASGINQASLVETALIKYLTDDMNADIPLMVEDADYIEEPAELDLSLLQSNLSGEIKGKFYIYGPYKKVTYDYPEKYIQKVYNEYTGNKSDILIQGTQFIDTSKLVTLKLIPNEAITSYFLSNNGEIIQMPKDDQYDSVKESNKAKVSTPVITPSKSSPYYEGEKLSFTATSYSKEGSIRYTWEGINSNNEYTLGTHTVSVIATDKKGNKSDKASFTFEVVKKPKNAINNPPTKPVIKVNPVKDIYLSSDTIILTALSTDPDGDDIEYIWINKPNDNKYPRGISNVSVYAVDTKGATSPKSTIRLIVDNGKPTINSVKQSPLPAYQYDNITLTPDVIDPDGDIVTLEWNGINGINAGKFSIGEHKYKVRAKDSFGAISDWYDGKIVISNYPPTTPTITVSPSGNLYANTNITLTASGSTDRDNHKITYEWENKKTNYARGTHTVKVRAKDELGAYSDYATKNIIILNSLPTIPTTLSVNPSTRYADTNLTYSASGSTDIDRDNITYEYSLQNGKPVAPWGTHKIKVRAKDSVGAYSEWKEFSFTVKNKPPTAPKIKSDVNLNNVLLSTTKITFTAYDSVDIDRDAITYEIKEQNTDGTLSNLPSSKTYSPGMHTIKARAKDSYGNYSEWTELQFVVNFKVLEIYAYTPQLGNVVKTYGMNKIEIDSYFLDDFNVNNVNVMNYDMILFGFADCYHGCTSEGVKSTGALSNRRLNDVIAFGATGRGVLLSHDTYARPNFGNLMPKVGASLTEPYIYWTGTIVNKVNEGTLTTYPYQMPNVLEIAPTHAQSAGATDGFVWFAQDTVNPKQTWYIISKDNWIFTSIGHSIPSSGSLSTAPVNEQKLLINTVFYTSQFREYK